MPISLTDNQIDTILSSDLPEDIKSVFAGVKPHKIYQTHYEFVEEEVRQSIENAGMEPDDISNFVMEALVFRVMSLGSSSDYDEEVDAIVHNILNK